MLGIVGGSGFESFEDFSTLGLLDRETPFGLASSGFKKVKLDGVEALFLSRHGEHHELLPSEVNYQANIFAMKKQGAKALISISAVGSLDKNLKPGDLVIPNQYIDRTKSIRKHTFLGDGLVGHVSLAKPTCEVMTNVAKKILKKHSFKSHFEKTYLCVEGPYFSTKSESISYRQMGAEIIGMTNFPEYGLAREAGLPYLPLCWVTDFDCWDDAIPHVTLAEVIRVMKGNNGKAFALLKDLLKGGAIWEGSHAVEGSLRTSLFMPIDKVPADKRYWLNVLTK